ncbi:flagellar basal body P-ring formation protein FlgA [candidate division KSB1 bacterium]|nr:flagellar basal body P-ring formation protein FlgA [candidate division KSB1 bacterium]
MTISLHNKVFSVSIFVVMLTPVTYLLADSGGMQAVSKTQIEQRVRAGIDKSMPDAVTHYEVEFRDIPESTPVPAGIINIRAELTNPEKYRGYLLCYVYIDVNQAEYKKISVSVKVRTFENVVVVSADIPRQDACTPENLRLENIETTTLQQDAFYLLDALKDMRAKRYLRAGTILNDSMIEPVPVVERGDLVTLIVRQANVTISTIGKAMDDGCIHDVIDVKNLDSNKRLKGEVLNARQVLIRADVR